MMQDEQKTKAELLQELDTLRRHISELEQTEQRLKDSEKQFKELFENAPCVILTVKPDGTILFLNRTVPPYTAEKAVGTSIYEYVPPEYQQTLRDALELVLRTGEPYSYEIAGCGPDGRTSWYQSRLEPIKKDGQVVALTLIATDVTEHKQAEIELRQSEHKYRTLLENLPQKIFLKDRNSVYLSCNENVAKDFKIKAEEIVGKTDYDLVPKELAEKYRADDKRIMESGQTQDIEERYIQDGQEVIIQTVKTPVKDDQGNVVGILGIFWDITERKKAEQDLQAKTAILQNIISNIPYYIFWKDENSIYLGCNDNFAKLAGIEKPEDIIGKTDYDLPWKKEESDFYRKIDKEVMSKGVPILNIEEPVHHGQGNVATILTSKVPLRNTDGEITGILGIFTDITERKKAEKEQEKLLYDLNERVKELRCLYNLSNLAQQSSLSLEEMFQRAVDLVPPGWQYPDVTCARIILEDKEFKTDNFETAKWKQAADIVMRGKKSGVVEVCYLEEKPESDEGPFLKEERDLTNVIAGQLGKITERRKAEQSLKESEEKYKKLFEETTDAIIVADPETGILTDCNRAASELVGREKSELIGKHQRILHPPQEIDGGSSKSFKQHIAEKGGQILEAQIITKKGEIRDVEIRASRFEHKGEKRIQGMFRDITERKKAEEKIKEIAEQWSVTFDSITDLVSIQSRDFKIVKVNKAFADLSKLKPDELIGRFCYEVIHCTKEPWPTCPHKRVLETGKPATIEFFEPNLGIYLQVSTSPILDDSGEITGTVHIAKDITERKKAEEALRESQSQQRAILDSIPDIAWLKDKESRYVAANEPLCKAFGIKLEDLAGKTDFDISPEDLARKYIADDQEVMKSGKRKRVEELWAKKEGERIWIETIKIPIFNDEGHVIGTSGIARDITERKKAEEELREYRRKMARAEQLASLGTLSASLAHELTQPLSVINLLIENALTELETTSYPGTVANKLRDMLTEVSRVNSVAHRFRDAVKRSSERIIKQVDLKAVAERTLQLFDESARRAKITLHLTDFDKLPPIYSSEEELNQVFFALVDNAIQAACPMDEPVRRKPARRTSLWVGGPLEGEPLGRRADGKKSHQLVISGARKDKHIELRFSDNCGGIAPEHLDKIFDPFFTTKPAGEAMGLGLCVVEHIVSQASGKVSVESKLGEGTTFYVTLPINIHAM